ncbi:cell division protein [Noviherbaspirillum sp. CPCC 100848]|uniref:Cell division protein n=1 Tax=Noviherbaspirillum album TaxID=3080276 RepID=A0ABU6JD73_9BURK|nr:cell division protein [Noviherbaspirillum sp. CPCC 100848]MEC4721270.1 cell division protein [Noviherbaspirillum sp. CPCC 100848]
MTRYRTRRYLIRWLYAVAIFHCIVGALLPWVADAALFEGYHRSIETAFWQAAAPGEARNLQTWWISLFGPTIQAMSLWMMALIGLAARRSDARIWLWLIAGLAIWAPQDMLVSLRAGCWIHVWIDSIALIAMLPPLFWLHRHDAAHRSFRAERH